MNNSFNRELSEQHYYAYNEYFGDTEHRRFVEQHARLLQPNHQPGHPASEETHFERNFDQQELGSGAGNGSFHVPQTAQGEPPEAVECHQQLYHFQQPPLAYSHPQHRQADYYQDNLGNAQLLGVGEPGGFDHHRAAGECGRAAQQGQGALLPAPLRPQEPPGYQNEAQPHLSSYCYQPTEPFGPGSEYQYYPGVALHHHHHHQLLQHHGPHIQELGMQQQEARKSDSTQPALPERAPSGDERPASQRNAKPELPLVGGKLEQPNALSDLEGFSRQLLPAPFQAVARSESSLLPKLVELGPSSFPMVYRGTPKRNRRRLSEAYRKQSELPTGSCSSHASLAPATSGVSNGTEQASTGQTAPKRPRGKIVTPSGQVINIEDVELPINTRRKNATRESTCYLKEWLDEHQRVPYPGKVDKVLLSVITNMTLVQVSTWFANARRRMKKENKLFWCQPERQVSLLSGSLESEGSSATTVSAAPTITTTTTTTSANPPPNCGFPPTDIKRYVDKYRDRYIANLCLLERSAGFNYGGITLKNLFAAVGVIYIDPEDEEEAEAEAEGEEQEDERLQQAAVKLEPREADSSC